jgi:hypothetical protein
MFADRGCHVVSVTNPYGRILGFLDREQNQHFSFSLYYIIHDLGHSSYLVGISHAFYKTFFQQKSHEPK